MKSHKPIFWHQGLFVKPQHFQLNDLFHQSLLRPFQSQMHPFFWGVCRSKVQAAALKNFVFELIDGEFLFPDGAWVVIPENAVVQPRSFKNDWTDLEKPFRIYLGLRRWDRKGENATVLEGGEFQGVSTRFVCSNSPDEVPDLYQKGPEAAVKSLDFLVRVFWEGELEDAGNYMLIPFAQLEHNGKEPVLSQGFVPPVLTLSGSDNLMIMVRAIREQVVSRCHVLEEYKIPKGTQLSDLEPNYISYFLVLRSLNRYVPFLNHVTETPLAHPWDFYGFLRQLIGELSSFSDRVDCLGNLKDGSSLVPPYSHENIGLCIQEASTLLSELLGSILIGAENVIHLVKDGDYHSASLSPEVFDARNVFHLILRSSSTGAEQIKEQVQRRAKISSSELIPVLIKRALPGTELQEITVLPVGVPSRPDSAYYRLNRGDDHWLEIQKNQNICLYWNESPADLAAELVITKK